MVSVPASHRNALPPGASLLWYQIERVLGQGAFGITYLATDTNLHRPVAIKEYLPSQLSMREADGSVMALTDDLTDEYGDGLRRFVTEGRTLAKFEHSSIVRVHNVFEANHTAYMVMQYEEGEDLGQVLKRRRTLPEAEILQLIYPLLAGLEVIHAQGFVHRDIKPGNIFIRKDGTPLLLDFGSAREAMTGESRTLTNFVSPGYAPIEQYSSKSDQQGPWSDIYGLGATIYRAMTSRAPIDAVERSHALAQETEDSYQTGAQNAQGKYSEALLAAVDNALRFRGKDRPPTIAAWRQQLPPLHAEPDSSPPASPVSAPVSTPLGAADVATVMLTMQATELQPPHVPTEPIVPGHSVPTQRLATPPSAPEVATVPQAPTPKAITAVEKAEASPSAGLKTKHYVMGFAGLVLFAVALGAWLGRSLSDDDALPQTAVLAPSAAPVPAQPPLPDATAPQAGVEPSLPAVPEVPVAISPEQQRLDRITELLFAASSDLDALRLTSPAGQNAFEKYREILTLQSDHPAALRGVDAISDRYVWLIYRDLDAKQLARAESYLSKAESLAPKRPSVIEARSALELERQKALAPKKAEITIITTPEPNRMDKLRKNFEDFANEQKKAQRPTTNSRGNQLIDRLGGGN